MGSVSNLTAVHETRQQVAAVDQADLVNALGHDAVPTSGCNRGANKLILAHFVDVIGCEVVHDGTDDAGRQQLSRRCPHHDFVEVTLVHEVGCHAVTDLADELHSHSSKQ